MVNTGQTVLQDEGVLSSCTKRQYLCGFSCCKFSIGNWIMLLPNEYELATSHPLKRGHLHFKNRNHATCLAPCQKGDLKPIDCSWYPLFPVNQDATKFLVADHRKCPIPNNELIEHMLSVHTFALAWEKLYPGSLEKMAILSQDFVGYMPFPYKIENGLVVDMSRQEIQQTALSTDLPINYTCKDWTVITKGYNATTTPDDKK